MNVFLHHTADCPVTLLRWGGAYEVEAGVAAVMVNVKSLVERFTHNIVLTAIAHRGELEVVHGEQIFIERLRPNEKRTIKLRYGLPEAPFLTLQLYVSCDEALETDASHYAEHWALPFYHFGGSDAS